MGLYNTKMKTFAIIVLLTAVKTLNSSAGIKFNFPGDNFNIPQGRQTHYPEDNIPELKFCRPEAPCQYGEGDCTRHGDDGCESDLVYSVGMRRTLALLQGKTSFFLQLDQQDSY